MSILSENVAEVSEPCSRRPESRHAKTRFAIAWQIRKVQLLNRTLEEQHVVDTATPSCASVPTDLYAAWCYIKGFPVDEEQLAIEGMAQIEIEDRSTTALTLPQGLRSLTFLRNQSLDE